MTKIYSRNETQYIKTHQVHCHFVRGKYSRILTHGLIIDAYYTMTRHPVYIFIKNIYM